MTTIGPLLISLGMAMMVWPLYERRREVPEDLCNAAATLRGVFKIRQRIPADEMALIDKLRKAPD